MVIWYFLQIFIKQKDIINESTWLSKSSSPLHYHLTNRRHLRLAGQLNGRISVFTELQRLKVLDFESPRLDTGWERFIDWPS